MDHELVFALIFFPALVGALVLGAWGGWKRGWVLPLACLVGGVLLFWGGLMAAVGEYFSSWQASPDPPDEAFSDGGSLVFTLLLGWLPGLVLAGTSFAVARWVRVRRTRAASY
ncbi:MAG: hypothetical protein P8R46_08460 [Planctomycetota bacterium]|nr:hypothetical protein [Planctomycetota bacterium]